MSRAFKNRRKAIRDEKQRLCIPKGKDMPSGLFHDLQERWRRANEGPCLGTLEQFMAGRSLPNKDLGEQR